MTPQRDFEYISSLIIKFLKDEITDKEQQELDSWLAESAENRSLLESFKDTKQVQADVDSIKGIDVNEEWNNFQHKVNVKPTRWIKNWLPHVAAILLITFALGFYYQSSQKSTIDQPILAYDVNPGDKRAVLQLSDGGVINLSKQKLNKGKHANFDVKEGTIYFSANHQKDGKKNYNALRTPRAGEYKIVLPDGTQVWLNASTYLRFPENFDGEQRRVELRGEAYFEVAHQPDKPFIVSFNNTEVKVLGTHFNINTYGSSSKTTLIEGSVSISEGSQEKMLKPGQEALINESGISVQKTEVYKSIAWKEGVFYFHEDGIKEVLSQVARWYDVEIVYEGKPGQQTISGNIRRQATLSQVLEMLSTLTNAKFNLTDRTVTVNFNH